MQSIPAESTPAERVPLYDGLRATADEYLALPDDEFRNELIDGVDLVVEVVSPRSRPRDTQTKFGDYERFGVLEH